MRRFVVIATANRGVVNPPEPLDDAGQWLANLQIDAEQEAEREILRARATRHYQRERDRPLTDRERQGGSVQPAPGELQAVAAPELDIFGLRKPALPERHVDAMMRLSAAERRWAGMKK